MGATTWSTVNKVGLGMQFVYGLANISSISQGPGINTQEPLAVLLADTILGTLLVVAVIVALRSGNRSVASIASGTNVLITLIDVPVLFIEGMPAWAEPVIAASIVWTAVSVALTHRPNKVATTWAQ